MNFLPAAYYRGGTSKGVFFKKADLPTEPKLEKALLKILGSPDPFGRQLNGMGGGLSSVSKAVFVGASSDPSIDLIYTFAQISVDEAVVEYEGNCGNLTSAVAPFGLHNALITCPDGRRTLRLFNTNTEKQIAVTLDVLDGQFNPQGNTEIAGVTGTGSRINLEFFDPGGAVTNALMPTNLPMDFIQTATKRYKASLIDATSPVVFIDGRTMGLRTIPNPDDIERQIELMSEVETIRRRAAVRMGIATDDIDVPMVNPKIALVFPPATLTTISGEVYDSLSHDIAILMFSMGRVHRAITLTGSMCLAAAIGTKGSIPNQLIQTNNTDQSVVTIGHPSGLSAAHVHIKEDRVLSTSIDRTARLLMDGRVFY